MVKITGPTETAKISPSPIPLTIDSSMVEKQRDFKDSKVEITEQSA
jgi:hypothetical protein